MVEAREEVKKEKSLGEVCEKDIIAIIISQAGR